MHASEVGGDAGVLLRVGDGVFRWDIQEEDFQIEFMDAVLSYPFLTALTLYTGYKVTSTAYELLQSDLSRR